MKVYVYEVNYMIDVYGFDEISLVDCGLEFIKYFCGLWMWFLLYFYGL